ncbi:hypothetical protein J421_3890 [Gemmatirosa kalamazoonensis]|uniref:Lipoprotein n=1 Tax=Gemmatirosa kalamazoonensis TaxID=861299 RepID=W0RLU3_9BACT|nr:hypothetical protein [Gemmatirosa kalamazoonensis]AHG91427.1 hypothetical protein J421_3890 [Gemmatirosa kalamazoonensis]
MRRALIASALLAGMTACAPLRRGATYDEQIWLPASHNWTFRAAYPSVDRLFNAFDYGHARVYDRLARRAPAADIERADYDWITTRLLRHPPSVPLDEAAIGPAYVRLAPELRAAFEWAHMLHRQLYDVCADARLTPAQRDAAAAAVLRYYRSRPDLALSTVPKRMGLMESGPHALGFRRAHPRYNGLLWSYHWLQMTLYDALLAGGSRAERDANVRAVTARFFAMLDDAPRTTPADMPMAAAIAPAFAARYPEAAIVFDNLHALHDVVADILAAPGVPDAERRRLLLGALTAYRDDVTQATTVAEWRDMAEMMDLARMGGAARDAFGARRP